MNRIYFNRSRILLVALLALSITASNDLAWSRGGHGFHPRRAEVRRRDNRMANTMNQDRGHLGGHYGQLQRQDASIHKQAHQEQLQNGGYLTKNEQKQLNQRENGLNQRMAQDYQQGSPSGAFGQKHPRRANILNANNQMNGQLNSNYSKLGGNYGQLEKRDMSIRRQEQYDSRMNSGAITPAQQAELRKEQRGLQNHINRDLSQQ